MLTSCMLKCSLLAYDNQNHLWAVLFTTTTATKTPKICIFDNGKQYFCTLCTCIFHLLTFWKRSRSFYDVNGLFYSCVDDVSIWWQMFNFVCLCPKRWFQFNSRIVRTHFFLSIISLNNWKMIAKTRGHIFRWRSHFRRRRVCLNSLIGSLLKHDVGGSESVIWKCNFAFLQPFLNYSRSLRWQNVFLLSGN